MADNLLGGLSDLSKLLGNPKNLIKQASKFAPLVAQQVSDNLANSATTTIEQRLQFAGQQFSQPIQLDPSTVNTISFLSNIGTVFTLFIIIWSVLLLMKQYTNWLSQEQKDNINYINSIIFGSIGVIPLLFIFWMLILMYFTVIPVASDTRSFIARLNGLTAILLGAQ